MGVVYILKMTAVFLIEGWGTLSQASSVPMSVPCTPAPPGHNHEAPAPPAQRRGGLMRSQMKIPVLRLTCLH